MTRRTSLMLWAAAFLAGLATIYAVYAFGNYAQCVVALSFGQLSGFYPVEMIRQECINRFFFSFFLFR